ncbi:uncharacterized protein LOC119723159 [Patiria miniata]|uniref:Uncharacterized protein n=1 Tax=Patiria miniata TaxID=46514 RepID=A0A913ZF98_PATMI|nr:uncharacterized protein LOC119723159 [Patiria miniata]
MAIFRLLSVLSLYVVSLAMSASSTCCPSCSLRSVDPLNPDQIAQIESNRAFIREIEDNPMLLHNQSYQRSVVNLTQNQQIQILRNIPQLFLSAREFEESLLTRGTITVPGEGTVPARRRRATAGKRVCQPVMRYQPLILALRADRRDLVEYIQMPGQDKNQWILEESCDDSASSPPAPLACAVVERDVTGVFVTLSDPYIFDHAYVVVQSCVTVFQ